MKQEEVVCPHCGENGTLYHLDTTIYPILVDDEGNQEIDWDDPDDTPWWVLEKHGIKDLPETFCVHCREWIKE